MLKIFVTGDNHIGLKYGNHGAAASVLASKRTEAFKDMVETANEEECGLFVITGDLFEDMRVSKRDINAVLDILGEFRGYVIVLPGNHDYYDKESRLWQWFEEIMRTKDNILLLSAYMPYHVSADGEEVVIYPALCDSKHSAQNKLGWIKSENIMPDGGYHIGIAHGAVEGESMDDEGRYFLMRREELEGIPVDVWLLGHTHVPFPKNLTEDFVPCDEKIFNPGTHVQTDVGCNTEGLCFIIEIDEEKNIRAKKVISGNVRFFRKNIELRANEAEDILKRELDGYPDNSVVDIILSGAVAVDEYEGIEAVAEKYLSRFTEGKYNTSALSKLISKDLIEREFAETSFSAKLLTALLDEPKEAQLAYELLTALKEGK